MLSDGELLEDPGRVFEIPEYRWSVLAPTETDLPRDGFLLRHRPENAEPAQAAE